MLTKDNFRNRELYSVEEKDGVKFVHILAFCFKADDKGPKDHRLTEYTFCLVPLDEFISEYKERGEDYVSSLEQEVQQYEADLTEDEAFNAIRYYFGEKGPKPLTFASLTTDSPCGNFIDL